MSDFRPLLVMCVGLVSSCMTAHTNASAPSVGCKARHTTLMQTALNRRSRGDYSGASGIEIRAAEIASRCDEFMKNPPGIDMVTEGANLLSAAEDARKAGHYSDSLILGSRAEKVLSRLVGVPKSALGQRLVLDFLQQAEDELASWKK